MEQQLCKTCDSELDCWGACEECDYPPENYVKPGNEALMYINAYEVTRHYGGPEEGGWYFNHSEPLASIPIQAVSHEGHDSLCYRCNRAKRKENDENGNPFTYCKWGFHLVANDEQHVLFREHLNKIFEGVSEGNIYSVLGGSELNICLEDHPAAATPRPHYE